ncbi:hypothetical protein FP803_01240 [Candidatus Woesearchaeota archaeon]|nr:hypothetical protein [Candidatus Woesearchaeota archaeon]
MTDVYKTSKYPNLLNDCGCDYANKIIEKLEGIETYALAEELSRIETFRTSLQKDQETPLSNESLQKMIDSGEYPLTVDEELSHIGAFRTFLPKDKGAQSPSDESLQDMIDSGEDFFNIPKLHLRLSNYKSKVVKESYRPSSK